MIRRCPVCQTFFDIPEHRVRHGRGVHCSRKCQYIANRTKLSKPVASVCIGCGVMFMTSPCRLQGRKGGGKFCNRQCRDRHWKGPLNPSWQGGEKVNKRGPNWQAVRRAVLERDQTCVKCGQVKGLHVHHRVPFRMFGSFEQANDLANLVALCPSCHRQEEARFKWVRLQDDGGLLRLNAGGAAWELARERGMI